MVKRNHSKKYMAAVKSAKAGDKATNIVIRENNTQIVLTALDRQKAVALEEIGLRAERYAKRACPVDTGRLRASIVHELRDGGESVYIGTNVEYAPYVEAGARGRDPQPFLVPAAKFHGSEYRSVLERALKNA